MKTEFKRLPKLKLRALADERFVDLQARMRKEIKKKSFFAYYTTFRLIMALAVSFITVLYLLIEKFVETGDVAVTLSFFVLFLFGISNGLIIIIVFHFWTKSLRGTISTIVDNGEYVESQVLEVYEKAFALPIRFTVVEFMASVVFMLMPLLLLEINGIFAFGIDIAEILIAWWLGTMSLLLSSVLFLDNWVERVMTRLYDYGLRISSPPGRKKSNILLRVFSISFTIILTLILLYANILADIFPRLPAGLSGRYIVQFVFVSLFIILGIGSYLLAILGTMKRSFDILKNKMKSIQQGDYSIRILNFRNDRIGELLDDFDYMVSTLNKMLGTMEEEINRRTARLEDINARLSKYLSPQLYSMIYRDQVKARLSHARKKLTIFFSDIVGFTRISENLAPEDMSRVLNQYLDVMAGIALKWGGTIDKYIGDAIMVFFGDPEYTNDKDHAIRCVRMSLEMLDELSTLREEWVRAGIPYPLHIRIGINTGFCTVGNFGTENRMDYTVIGSAVNLASRLQTAAAEDGILISETTHLLVNDSFACSEAGLLKMKGIDQPVKAYRVDEIPVKKNTREAIEYHTKGFDLRIDSFSINDENRQQILKALNDAYCHLSVTDAKKSGV